MIRINICNNNNLVRKGMTLIELLIVVAVIALLAAIAYPSYTNHVLKAHRTTALADLAKIQLQLESEYNSGYSWGNIISGGACLTCDSDSDRYRFTISSSSTMAYTITATAQSRLGQDQDSCLPRTPKTITLNAAGAQTPEECWE
ncbi:type IV pilin protein [Vibrio makurazakiensis]|uniref:type IV pilin protein n=1 Tax=Vibrio makurazakiensis TaxID=2910250 RepID=UPI003D0B9228